MKNLSFILLFWAFSLCTLLAQINKGSWSMGGNLSFSGAADNYKRDSLNDQKGSYFNLMLHPMPQYFFAKNWALRFGVGLGYYNQSSNNGTDKSTEHRLSINPTLGFRRYFFLDAAKQKFAFLLQSSVFYFQEMRFSKVHHSPFHHFSVGAHFSPGFAFFVKERWSLELTLGQVGYTFSFRPDTGSSYTYHSWSAQMGLSFGFQYFIFKS